MPVSEGSQEFCPATAFSHGSNLNLKRTAIPLVLLYFYHSCDQGSFLLVNICLKYLKYLKYLPNCLKMLFFKIAPFNL